MMEYSHILKSNYHTFLQNCPHYYAHHFNMEDQKKLQHSFLLDLHMVILWLMQPFEAHHKLQVLIVL